MSTWLDLIYYILFFYLLLVPMGRTFFQFSFSHRISCSMQYIFIFIGAFTGESGDWREIVMALPAGLAYLPVMLTLTVPSLARLNIFYWCSRMLVGINKKAMRQIVKITLSALKEELIWRVSLVWLARKMMISDGIILWIGSVCFYAIHWRRHSPLFLLTELELFLFSLMLYIFYLKTDSFFGVWIIHAARNIFIYQFRRAIKSDTIG